MSKCPNSRRRPGRLLGLWWISWFGVIIALIYFAAIECRREFSIGSPALVFGNVTLHTRHSSEMRAASGFVFSSDRMAVWRIAQPRSVGFVAQNASFGNFLFRKNRLLFASFADSSLYRPILVLQKSPFLRLSNIQNEMPSRFSFLASGIGSVERLPGRSQIFQNYSMLLPD